jgi:hypothetical protein
MGYPDGGCIQQLPKFFDIAVIGDDFHDVRPFLNGVRPIFWNSGSAGFGGGVNFQAKKPGNHLPS